MENIYATKQAEDRLAEITREIGRRVKTELIEHDIETTFARTRIVEGGRKDGRPLVLLHGGGTDSYFALYMIRTLLTDFHVYGVETPGHPGGSECVFIDPRGNDAGHWIREVADGLSLESANYLGVSMGGFVIQRLAAVAPERISKAVFVVSAGIVNPRILEIARNFVFPQLLCKWTGNPKFLGRLMNAVFTTDDDELVREYFEIYFQNVRSDMRQAKRVQREEMNRFTAPKLFVGADQDIIFPGAKMQARCAEVFSAPYEFELLNDSRHSPPMTGDKHTKLITMIDDFLKT